MWRTYDLGLLELFFSLFGCDVFFLELFSLLFFTAFSITVLFSSSQTNNFSCNKSSVIASFKRLASMFFSFESFMSASTSLNFAFISFSETSIFSDSAKAFKASFAEVFFLLRLLKNPLVISQALE